MYRNGKISRKNDAIINRKKKIRFISMKYPKLFLGICEFEFGCIKCFEW